MSDAQQLLGEVNGKVDLLIQMHRDHAAVHETLDIELKAHAKDINQAKGVKNAILAAAAAVAGTVSLVAVAARHFIR